MVRLVVAVVALVVVVVVLWRRLVRDVPERYRRLVDAGEMITIGALVLMLVALAVKNMRSPLAWDFPVFYTVGRNVVLGESFYDPVALLRTFSDIQASAGVPNDWLGEFGFWYAPPTALVLAPVGVPSYTLGLGIQYAMQFAFLGATVVVLHRAFPLREGAMGLVEMGILVVAFRPLLEAVTLAQIVFGAVLGLAVAFATLRDRPVVAGIALGLGTLFKHLLLIPAVLVLVLGRVRTMIAALATLVGMSVVAAIVFGPSVFTDFVTFGPSDRPPTLALDPEIESLNGVLRRLFDSVPSASGALDAIMYPPYLLVAGILTAVSIAIVWRARSTPDGALLGFGVFTTLALICYPNTLFNTLPIMIPVLVVIVYLAERLAVSTRATLIVVTGSYLLVLTRLVPGILMMTAVWAFLCLNLVLTSGSRRTEAPHESMVG